MPTATTLELVAVASFPSAAKLYQRSLQQMEDSLASALGCGRMLRGLRDETKAQGKGGGGDRKSAAYKAGEITSSNVGRSDFEASKNQTSNVGRLIFDEELAKAGIPKSTAYNWIEQVDRYDELRAIRDGQRKTLRIEIEDGGDIKVVDQPIKESDLKRAELQLVEIDAGRLWPKRAWAGFRSGLVTASAKRAPANVCALIREAMATLDRQLPKLKSLTDDERLLLKKFAGAKQLIERMYALEVLK